MRLILCCLLSLFLSAPAVAATGPADKPIPGFVRVRIETSEGPITVALDARRAPRTTANFLAYVDDGRLDGTFFYRTARRKGDPKFGFVQGGIGTDLRRSLDPVMLESTDKTGIHHTDGVISMARNPRPDSATGNFSIMVGDNPMMDAGRTTQGYAAFGHVVSGMDTVRKILAKPSGGGSDEMKGQMILQPVRLISAKRLDGVAHPTGRPKAWQLLTGH
jgi:peptidyl-prolyl cis-trans isomerase A (cyclophilin A)